MFKSAKALMFILGLSLVGLGGTAGCHGHDDSNDHDGYWNSQDQHNLDRENYRDGDRNGMNDHH